MPRKPNVDQKPRYYEPFPSALRQLMAETKTTYDQMKEVLGLLNRQSVTGYVDGRTPPTSEKIVAVAEYFGVSTDYLLGLSKNRTVDKNQKAAAEYTGLSDSAVALLHEMNTNEKYFAPIPKGLVFHLGSWLPELASAMITAPSFVRLLKSFENVETAIDNAIDNAHVSTPEVDEYADIDETDVRYVHFAIFESTEFLKMVIDEMYNTGKFFKAVSDNEQG